MRRRDFLRWGVTGIVGAGLNFAPFRITNSWAQYKFSPSGKKYPKKLGFSSQVAAITPGYIWEYTKLIERHLKIEAEYSTYAAGAPQMQAFAMGKWDMGYVGVPPMMTALDKGIKTVAIAVGHQEGANVIGRKDRGFRTLAELKGDIHAAWRQFKGKIIGLPPQSSIQDAVTRTSLREAGLPIFSSQPGCTDCGDRPAPDYLVWPGNLLKGADMRTDRFFSRAGQHGRWTAGGAALIE